MLLPVPLLLIVAGFAQPLFPLSDPSSPSSVVAIVQSKRTPSGYLKRARLPVYINWTQWESVVVPLLGDIVVTGWRGQIGGTGDLLSLLQDLVGVDGSILYPTGTDVGYSGISKRGVGKLYACDPPQSQGSPSSKTSAYLENLSLLISTYAKQAGYS